MFVCVCKNDSDMACVVVCCETCYGCDDHGNDVKRKSSKRPGRLRTEVGVGGREWWSGEALFGQGRNERKDTVALGTSNITVVC